MYCKLVHYNSTPGFTYTRRLTGLREFMVNQVSGGFTEVVPTAGREREHIYLTATLSPPE